MPDTHQIPLNATQITLALQKVHGADTTPQLGSVDMVTSDGVAKAVNALEAAQAQHVQGWIYSGVNVGPISASTTVQDLDLSDEVGSNRALVMLQVWGGSTSSNLYFRHKGSPVAPVYADSYAGSGSSACIAAPPDKGSIVVSLTNSGGVLEYHAHTTVSGINTTLLAYQILN